MSEVAQAALVIPSHLSTLHKSGFISIIVLAVLTAQVEPYRITSIKQGQTVVAFCDHSDDTIPRKSFVTDVSILIGDDRVYHYYTDGQTKYKRANSWLVTGTTLRYMNGHGFNITFAIPKAEKGDSGVVFCKVPYSLKKYQKANEEPIFAPKAIYVRDADDSVPCPDNWAYYKQRKTCVAAFSFELPWQDARDYCKNTHSADLVSIPDIMFDDFVKAVIMLDMGAQYWIGWRKDDGQDKDFQWVNGMQSGYTNGLETARRLRSNDKCGVKLLESGIWMGKDCRKPQKFVCQRPEVQFQETLFFYISVLIMMLLLMLLSACMVSMFVVSTPLETIRKVARFFGFGEAEEVKKEKVVIVLYESELNEILRSPNN